MKKQEYKVGDRVKVLSGWIDEDLIGKTLPIVKITGDRIWLKGSKSFWPESDPGLKLVSPLKPKKSKKKKEELSKFARDFIKRARVCEDCKECPAFKVGQMGVGSTEELCKRHFYLFTEKFKKWFLEGLIVSPNHQ